ncbi:MAG: sugar phosphate isomerase/epimerase, partial [Prevotella sp.]|nr:sugar phosphate isomerase/epimerase [Prevotella sp.]
MKNKVYLLLVLASLIILPQTIQAQNKGKVKKDIAIQLYSVRDRIGSYVNQTGKYDTDYTAILKELAQMGYTAVEAAGYNDGKFYNRTPQEFRKDVETAGLKVLSSHCTKPLTPEELISGDFTESLKWWDTAIKAHKDAGM